MNSTECCVSQILDCITTVTHNGKMKISILPEHPKYQNNGYGDTLMTAAESAAGRVEKCTAGMPP